VSVVSVVAASYFTACDDEFNNSNMHLIYRGCKTTKMRMRMIAQQIKKTYSMCCVVLTIQPDDFYDAHLQKLI
jgi:hypothetical protein